MQKAVDLTMAWENNIIWAELIGKLERTDTGLGKSYKIRDTGLIWELGMITSWIER